MRSALRFAAGVAAVLVLARVVTLIRSRAARDIELDRIAAANAAAAARGWWSL